MELTPGPNMAFLATLGALDGRRSGLATVAGICLGLSLLGLACAFGLGAAVNQWPALLSLLRLAGVGFLLFLAWEAWREAGESSVARAGVRGSALTWFRRGLTVNLLNPKAALFYVAVLPTFVMAGQPTVPQVLVLSAVSVVIATLVHGLIVMFAASLKPFLTDPARTRSTRRIMALLLAGVAVWFGLTSG